MPKKKKEKDPVVARLEGEVRILSDFVKVLERGESPVRAYVSKRLVAQLYPLGREVAIVRVVAIDTAGHDILREVRWVTEFTENPCKGLLTITTMTDGKTTPHDPELWEACEAAAETFSGWETES